MLQIYDRLHNKVQGLTKYTDLTIERTLDGLESLSFTSPYYASSNLNNEVYVRTKRNEYIIKEIDKDDYFVNTKCQLNLEELKGKEVEKIDVSNSRLEDTVNLALVGTGYTSIITSNKNKRRTIRKALCSAYEVLEEIRKVYRIELRFDTISKIVYVHTLRGSDKGAYFHHQLNLRKLVSQRDTYEYITRIIPIGKDNLRIETINGGKDYVENKQFTQKTVTKYWEDNRYTDMESLKEDATAKLDELSKPYISYISDVIDLAKASKDSKYGILDYDLGDMVEIINKKQNVREGQRIVKITEYPDNPEKNVCELANKVLKFEDLQEELFESSEIVDSISNTDGTVDGSKIDGIKVEQIKNFEAELIKVTNLEAINASIQNLTVNKASVTDLEAARARIGTLEVTKATITQLEVVKATIKDLEADTIRVKDLEAVNAKITNLEAKNIVVDNLIGQNVTAINLNATNLIAAKGRIDTLESTTIKTDELEAVNADITILKSESASIKNLVNGNLTSENIQAGSITAGSGIIADGAIGNAQISKLSVDKLESGIFSTSRFTVQGEDGRLKIENNLLQVFDGSTNLFERVALGDLNKDGTEYGLRVRGADGTTILLDENGLTDVGFTDGYEKLGDNSLDPKKIDINKVINRVNQDGSISISGTKVVVGNKTLDVELSERNIKSLELETNISNNTASITANTNQIRLKLDEQEYSQYKSLVDGKVSTIETNLSKATTDINILQGEISLKASKTEVETVESKIDGLEINSRNLILDSNIDFGFSEELIWTNFANKTWQEVII